MGRPVAFTKSLAAAGATKVSAAQTLGAAGNLLINGTAAASGVATLDSQRRILFTTTEDDSARTWTIYGTNDAGSVVVDTGTLPASATKASNLDFLTVTRISIDGAIGANVSVGTNTIGSSPWAIFDPHLTPPSLSLVDQLLIGSGTSTVEYTSDPVVMAPGVQSAIGYGYVSPNPLALPHPSLQGVTATTEGVIDFTITGWRLTINSGTGTWKCTGIQAGLIQ